MNIPCTLAKEKCENELGTNPLIYNVVLPVKYARRIVAQNLCEQPITDLTLDPLHSIKAIYIVWLPKSLTLDIPET